MTLLTTAEVAQLLRICPQSVRDLCNEKKLKFIRHSKRGKRLILSESVEAFRHEISHSAVSKLMQQQKTRRKERSSLSVSRRTEAESTRKRISQSNPQCAIAKSYRRNAEKQLRQNHIDRAKIAQTKLALKRHNSTCLDHNMPAVPAPRHRAVDVACTGLWRLRKCEASCVDA